MNPARTAFYDAETRSMWIARRFFRAQTRVARDEITQWVRLLKNERQTEDGRPVEAINYLFIDRETAACNYEVLTYAGLGVYHQEGGNRIPYLPDDSEIEFDVRADFDIPSLKGLK